ncbi:MAG: SMC-Scp complex subunit ScpB [Sediminibacterium sp.]|nr:SMC-Scp complex subunit ScpB [Sediminibacterium sp.]
MNIENVTPHIEALIFASDKPISIESITEIINQSIGFIEDKIEIADTKQIIQVLQKKYIADSYPFEIKELGEGYQFLSKKMYFKTISHLNSDKFIKKLTNAALETLSIITYKQPINKSEIEAIRGVNCDYSIQKLLEKELIVISGRNEELPGRPIIYSTSPSFMDYFGINSILDLPKINEIIPQEVQSSTLFNGNVEETNTV